MAVEEGDILGKESSLSNWAGPYVTDMLGRGAALADEGYQGYTGPLTAGQSELQTQAFQGIGGLNLPTETTGAFTPETFTADAAARYMNPYLMASLDPQIKEARRQSEIDRLQNELNQESEALAELTARDPANMAAYNNLFGNAVPANVAPSSGGGRGGGGGSTPNRQPTQAEVMANRYANTKVGEVDGESIYGYTGQDETASGGVNMSRAGTRSGTSKPKFNYNVGGKYVSPGNPRR